MERDISAAALAAMQNDELGQLIFADIDWADGAPVRVHSDIGTRPFDNVDFVGVGEFGGISDLNETNKTTPTQLTLTLKVSDPSLVGLVMNDSPEGRDVAIHMAILDENRVIEHEVPYLFDGYITKFNVKRGDVDKGVPYIIKLTCSDWLERWSQPPQNARTTNEAQQHLHPGDRIFDLTEIIAGSPIASLPTKNSAASGGGRDIKRGGQLR